jgi:hypothetical protein
MADANHQFSFLPSAYVTPKGTQSRAFAESSIFFSALMAACALASARGRDGALYGLNQNASHMASIPSETFFSAAKNNLSEDFVLAQEFDYMRACALLSITSIQYGDIEAMQLYLGRHFTLVGVHKFHNEVFRPKNITIVEVEERRRLVRTRRYCKQEFTLTSLLILVNLHS